MVADIDFERFLQEELAPLGYVTTRRMFGKTGLFCDGVMFAMVADKALYLRVDDQNRSIFEEAESAPALGYVKNGRTIDLAFWRVPDRLFDEHDELIAWSHAALGAAQRVAAKRRGPQPVRLALRRDVARSRK